MPASPLSFRWPPDFVARIDAARGDVPRSTFVRGAVERALAPHAADRVRRDVAARVEDRRPVAVDAGAVVYGCASCDFVASSPSARCPRHAGRLVERRL